MFKINTLLLRNFITNNKFQARFKHKANHWSIQRKKKSATTKALEYFDEFYESTYKKEWPQIRKGLLAKQKYVALINNYSDTDTTIQFLEQKGAFNMRTTINLMKEQLQEEHRNKKWQGDLERIWKLEKADTPITSRTDDNSGQTNPNFSLNQSLAKAQYDYSRIIDENHSTAVLYDFIPVTKYKGREDFIPEPGKIQIESVTGPSNGIPMPVIEHDLHFPEHLQVFCFDEDNFNDMPTPRKGSTGVLNYYLMDGGSILPVLALDLKPGSRLLDMCAAPGGKSLIALQTLYPNYVRCNDISISRTNRIFSVMKQYLYDFQERWLDPGKIYISQTDARYLQDEGFDRILVDVPCTIDRHSVREEDNNIFRADRIKERLQLPELQTELLVNALQLVKPGGVVVYSTCSLNPIQNQGVVQMALKHIWENTTVQVEIRDLSRILQQFRNIYQFCSPKVVKYGHLVLPISSQNYGPTYFCKLQRIK